MWRSWGLELLPPFETRARLPPHRDEWKLALGGDGGETWLWMENLLRSAFSCRGVAMSRGVVLALLA